MKGSDIMRIEKLEFNKVKVAVFPVDLMDMNISIKSLKPDSPQLHSFLSDIMERIKEETGFNPYSKRTVVEASPMGDCMVLTVTKICEKTNEYKRKKIKAVLKNREIKKRVFFFEDFDDLCGAISQMSDESLVEAVCYKIEKQFALSVVSVKQDEDGMLCEFSSGSDAHRLADDFLSEHGELIAQGEELLKMSYGIKRLKEKE